VRASTLTALWREGRLIRIKAGLYQLPDALADENADLVQAAAAVPGGVLCLTSALDYYGLTDASPEEVFMAIPMGDWAPIVTEPPVRFVRFRSRLFEMQVNEEQIGGRPVRIYSREKTLCDCLRLPGLVGLDVTLTALRRYIRSPHSNVSKLLETARACRISHRMLPYVEALLV
jgi:predicted transcriptional regulator of viral defense system